MTIKEFKDFITMCDDEDVITICTYKDDNPVSGFCDVNRAYIIYANNDNVAQVCLMPV